MNDFVISKELIKDIKIGLTIGCEGTLPTVNELIEALESRPFEEVDLRISFDALIGIHGELSRIRDMANHIDDLLTPITHEHIWHDEERDAAIAKKEREKVLDEISQSLTTCSFYDEMISAEGGCYGKRNGERNCDGCSYFEIDGNQLKSTIESLRGEL